MCIYLYCVFFIDNIISCYVFVVCVWSIGFCFVCFDTFVVFCLGWIGLLRLCCLVFLFRLLVSFDIHGLDVVWPRNKER